MVISKRTTMLLAMGLFAVVGLSQIRSGEVTPKRAPAAADQAVFAAPEVINRRLGRRSQPAPRRPEERLLHHRSNRGPLAPQPGGFMRGLGTAVLGGFLGSMLFSGIANAGGLGGLGGSGFGMMEILLLGGLAYFLYRKFRSPAVASGFGTMQYQNSQPYTQYSPTSHRPKAPVANNDIDYRSLTLMDRSFDPDRFLKTAQDLFFKVQGAWNKQDTTVLSSLCGAELMQNWQQELSQQRARGQQNRMENIALQESEVSEAWTENGADFITVRLHANLLDYTVDTKTGDVVSGSNSDPIKFEEYWTFTRPVGPNTWKLSAVQQA